MTDFLLEELVVVPHAAVGHVEVSAGIVAEHTAVAVVANEQEQCALQGGRVAWAVVQVAHPHVERTTDGRFDVAGDVCFGKRVSLILQCLHPLQLAEKVLLQFLQEYALSTSEKVAPCRAQVLQGSLARLTNMYAQFGVCDNAIAEQLIDTPQCFASLDLPAHFPP